MTTAAVPRSLHLSSRSTTRHQTPCSHMRMRNCLRRSFLSSGPFVPPVPPLIPARVPRAPPLVHTRVFRVPPLVPARVPQVHPLSSHIPRPSQPIDPLAPIALFFEPADRPPGAVRLPQEFVGDKINAGIYLISPSTLNRIEMRPTSIERETFPAIAADKRLFAFTLSGYWMDVGKPKDYLTGLRLHLQSLR